MKYMENKEKTMSFTEKMEKNPTENTDVNGMNRMNRVEISSLLGDAREMIFVHNGEEYRLRLTANNKLILTK